MTAHPFTSCISYRTQAAIQSSSWLRGVEAMPKAIRPWSIQEARDTYFRRLMDQLSIEHRKKAAANVQRSIARPDAALLPHIPKVDAQETKSLCCEAAGITALVRAADDARIPHEKLRRAATTEATLNAGYCPPAQLAQGYTHLNEKGNEPEVIGRLMVLTEDLIAIEVVATSEIEEGTQVIRLSDHRDYVATLRQGGAA
ncbi:hypothetical protein ACI2KS_10850 [Pseudomonas sp. NPDC087358]|uniref:hypothetical protein n=1 Tax=Pseudomonas sp. NPDC087358 TaxID=3364439 RepID=UPI003850F4F1